MSNNDIFTRRNVIKESDVIAFGCSHTWGTGVKGYQTWSHLLGARNFGEAGCSADFISRHLPNIIKVSLPKTVYILWPDWTRFEVIKQGVVCQSLPTDSDRILYMGSHDDNWLKENFKKQSLKVRTFCSTNNIELIDLTLYNLISWIDHADQWPLSDLGHHYSPIWHGWVANIFREIKESPRPLELAYE